MRLPHPWDSPGKNTGVGCHFLLQCRKVKSESEVAQLCPTLSDPMDYSTPGSFVHGIFQARVLEWAAIAFSITVGQKLSFCLFILFMGFSRQEYWSGLPFPSPVDHILSELSTISQCKELTHLKRPWCWERLKAGGEGDDRGWDSWMASPTRWTWVWVNSGSWRWTGRPGVLRSMGSQRVGHDWVTKLTD